MSSSSCSSLKTTNHNHSHDKRQKSNNDCSRGCECKVTKQPPVVTLTSGPVFLPLLDLSDGQQIATQPTVYMTIYNPTAEERTVDIVIHDTVHIINAVADAPQILQLSDNLKGVDVKTGPFPIAANSTRVLAYQPVPLPDDVPVNRIMTFYVSGDFVVGSDHPKCGLLEIEAVFVLPFTSVVGIELDIPSAVASSIPHRIKFAEFLVCAPRPQSI